MGAMYTKLISSSGISSCPFLSCLGNWFIQVLTCDVVRGFAKGLDITMRLLHLKRCETNKTTSIIVRQPLFYCTHLIAFYTLLKIELQILYVLQI